MWQPTQRGLTAYRYIDMAVSIGACSLIGSPNQLYDISVRFGQEEVAAPKY